MEYLGSLGFLPDNVIGELGFASEHAAALRTTDGLFLSVDANMLLHVTPQLHGFAAILGK